MSLAKITAAAGVFAVQFLRNRKKNYNKNKKSTLKISIKDKYIYGRNWILK